MSIRLMVQLWDNGDPDLTGSKLLIMLCLADHSNDDGVCWPSITRLASRTRIDKRNVIRHLHTLEDAGYLKIHRTPGRSNKYTISGTRGDITTSDENTTSGKTVTPTRDKNTTTTRGDITTPPVAILPPESSMNPHSEPSSESSSENDDSGLIDPDIARLLATWKETFQGTPFEMTPPYQSWDRWVWKWGVDAVDYMLRKSKDKRIPNGWLAISFDDWAKKGEIAPYIQKEIDAMKPAAPREKEKWIADFGDGIKQEVLL